MAQSNSSWPSTPQTNPSYCTTKENDDATRIALHMLKSLSVTDDAIISRTGFVDGHYSSRSETLSTYYLSTEKCFFAADFNALSVALLQKSEPADDDWYRPM